MQAPITLSVPLQPILDGIFLPLSWRTVGSSRRPFHLHAVHRKWGLQSGQQLAILRVQKMRVGGRTSNSFAPALCCNHRLAASRGASSAASQPCLSVYLFAQTQNELLRSTIFHICLLWWRALVLYGDVSKLMQEALTALQTTILVFYQHGDFRAFLVDIGWRKLCQEPIGVYFCHPLLRFFHHARQENPSLARWKPARVEHSHPPSILLESVSRRRLIDFGTLGMSDTFPTFLHNLLSLSLNTIAQRSKSQSCTSRSCLQN